MIKTTFGLSSVKVYGTFSRAFKIELEWIKIVNELKLGHTNKILPSQLSYYQLH